MFFWGEEKGDSLLFALQVTQGRETSHHLVLEHGQTEQAEIHHQRSPKCTSAGEVAQRVTEL